MRAFQKKIKNLLKVKKKYDQFLTQYTSRLLQPTFFCGVVRVVVRRGGYDRSQTSQRNWSTEEDIQNLFWCR